jgi:hypothetical protein
LPVVTGPCLASEPSYWFDAATGVCVPFVYGGCDGNENRFATIHECYAACGGHGDRDDAACTQNTECIATRLSEPCCTTDVRNFVGLNVAAELECSDPALRCNAACAADCAALPEDGYIGATCADGHCIPFDAREWGFVSCRVDSDCHLVYGMGCCGNDCCSPGFCSGCPGEGCPLEQVPSKLVAVGPSPTRLMLLCDPGVACPSVDVCDYPTDRSAVCDSGWCVISPR